LIDLLKMYPGAVNSVETFITVGVFESDTNITVQSIAGMPSAPFLLVLGGGFSNAETIKVTSISGNTLTVERAYQGITQAWAQGTTAAVNFTEAHYRALVNNIKTLRGGLDEVGENLRGILPTGEILSFPITQNDYFGAWDLLLCEGGISAPLEVWGFTNATLTTIPSRIVIDINTNTATLYAPPLLAGLAWDVHEYQSGVYILSAGNVALILIRRRQSGYKLTA